MRANGFPSAKKILTIDKPRVKATSPVSKSTLSNIMVIHNPMVYTSSKLPARLPPVSTAIELSQHIDKMKKSKSPNRTRSPYLSVQQVKHNLKLIPISPS